MVLQLAGNFTVSWPDGAGRPLTMGRTYTILWDATKEEPKAGAKWSLSGLNAEQQRNEDRSDSDKGAKAMEPRFG